MSSFTDYFIGPPYEKPRTSVVSLSAARALSSNYRWRHKHDWVNTQYHVGLTWMTKFFYRNEVLILHMTQLKIHWWYFNKPRAGLSHTIVDRFNGVSNYVGLPTLHQVGKIWVWSDRRLWTGARLFKINSETDKLKPVLQRLLERSWS